MIQLPDFNKAFDYENGFYLSSDISRLHKPIIHYELYKKTINVPGALVELGLFKGTSFVRFLAYREMLENADARKVIGFDTFGEFPGATLEKDKKMLKTYLDNAGNQSISDDQLMKILERKEVAKNVDLVKGDINVTLPRYINENPSIRFSLVHLDVDLYEPSVTALKTLFPLLSKGGIFILDDYGIWEGETLAVDEYLKDKNITLKRFPFAKAPTYFIKE